MIIVTWWQWFFASAVFNEIEGDREADDLDWEPLTPQCESGTWIEGGDPVKLPVERSLENEEKLGVEVRGTTGEFDEESSTVIIRGELTAQSSMELELMATAYNVTGDVIGTVREFVAGSSGDFAEPFELYASCSSSHGKPEHVRLSVRKP